MRDEAASQGRGPVLGLGVAPGVLLVTTDQCEAVRPQPAAPAAALDLPWDSSEVVKGGLPPHSAQSGVSVVRVLASHTA